jgi:hypothetical protein
MAPRPPTFLQSDLTKVLKAFVAARQPMPKIVIEPQRLTVLPVSDANCVADPNPWDAP